ncbi:uncharacterized protein FOMMEDRAFT_134471 [Fomitiporia mediterranea MF3/22]|uniref:uncharacterized protein n=1 Tax=Fomitiporia mediterranea (strain MF3/22) TaxID=694068 RepID=UPI0004408101|nr:uncharacterized protein FOMMEDRAFT_134471 [Fomitiporia mediterranea MF3/22]EJD01789.1 hypothetical protein FOMMEDRAFT_134471 [Fomitiporia mediterranea MF3/22]
MGKVHGSLARAGKVRSQTPKVEPQEKKKTPKGHGAYSLRIHFASILEPICFIFSFVNVTALQQGGKRKM